MVTWRAGSVVDMLPDTQAFAQYSTAAAPPSSLLALTPDNARFGMTRGWALEGGVKSALLDERLGITAAAFYIVQDDIVTRSAADLAGTDFDEHRAFSKAAEAQRRLMQDVISQDLIEHADGHGEQHFTYRASRELWAVVPAFEYRPPSAGVAFGRGVPSLGLLVAAAALWIAIAHAAMARRPLE